LKLHRISYEGQDKQLQMPFHATDYFLNPHIHYHLGFKSICGSESSSSVMSNKNGEGWWWTNFDWCSN